MNEKVPLNSEKDEVCAFCKSFATQKCSRCMIVYYCNREHQKLDWKRHKTNCRVYKLVEDPMFGKRYVATRQIDIGEMVITDDKPLLLVPEPMTECLICLNCYVPLTLNSVKPCNNCGWPLCVDCTTHGPECLLTMKYNKKKINIKEYSKTGVKHMFNRAIIVMRGLALRKKNPENYEKLMILGDRTIARMRKYNFASEHNDMAYLLKKSFMIDDTDEDSIGKILGAMMIHGFANKTVKNHRNVVVFETLSHIEHACRANCNYTCWEDGQNGGKVVIRAVTTIPKGHPITITWTSATEGTAQRRQILRESKFFDCNCERCQDPTEFGTMFSAVKCFEGKCTGHMLPPTFLVSGNEKIPNFVCDTCSLSTPSSAIDKMMENINLKLSTIDQNKVDELKKFINDHAEILHHNHFHIFNAKFKLAQTFYMQIEYFVSLSDELHEENITLCSKMIELFRILMPGEIRAIKRLLRMICSYMVTLVPKLEKRNPVEALRLIKEFIDQLDEINRFDFGEQISKSDTLTMQFLRLKMAELEILHT